MMYMYIKPRASKNPCGVRLKEDLLKQSTESYRVLEGVASKQDREELRLPRRPRFGQCG